MKPLLLLFSLMSWKNKKKTLDSSAMLIDSIKIILRKELLTILYKALIGILLVSITIIAIDKSGSSFQTIMARFENGYIFEFIGFILIALASLFFLHKLFNINPLKQTEHSLESNKDNSTVDFQKLAFTFLEGLQEGVIAHNRNNTSREN